MHLLLLSSSPLFISAPVFSGTSTSCTLRTRLQQWAWRDGLLSITTFLFFIFWCFLYHSSFALAKFSTKSISTSSSVGWTWIWRFQTESILTVKVKQADILVSCLHQPQIVQGDWIKPGAVVIDGGLNYESGQNHYFTCSFSWSHITHTHALTHTHTLFYSFTHTRTQCVCASAWVWVWVCVCVCVCTHLTLHANFSSRFFHTCHIYWRHWYYQFIQFSVALAIFEGNKVSRKQNLLGSFSCTSLIDQNEIWDAVEAFRTEQPDTCIALEWELLISGINRWFTDFLYRPSPSNLAWW